MPTQPPSLRHPKFNAASICSNVDLRAAGKMKSCTFNEVVCWDHPSLLTVPVCELRAGCRPRASKDNTPSLIALIKRRPGIRARTGRAMDLIIPSVQGDSCLKAGRHTPGSQDYPRCAVPKEELRGDSPWMKCVALRGCSESHPIILSPSPSPL